MVSGGRASVRSSPPGETRYERRWASNSLKTSASRTGDPPDELDPLKRMRWRLDTAIPTAMPYRLLEYRTVPARRNRVRGGE